MQPRIPIATYRLQFNRSLTFRQAAELVDYLADLGVSDCYASPVLMARPGSVHGYDVIDPTRLNPDLGSEEDFVLLGKRLRERQMGLLMDVVPNHMCISSGMNRYWNDVMENGPSSAFARYFDIDWQPPKAELRNKVLFPVLGDAFGKVLENQEIRISHGGGTFHAGYHELRLPVAPRSGQTLLLPALLTMKAELGPAHPEVMELESILTALSHLPLPTETDRDRARERQREKEIIRLRLEALHERSELLRRGIDASLQLINGRQGEPRSFDALEDLLSKQVYRLAYWHVAAEEINYRRFFDINDLAAIHVEDPSVFLTVHQLILRLIEEGLVSGLRIDHVDGLFDPRQYLNNLQFACRSALLRANVEAVQGKSFYVIVEKILGPDEGLPESWPIHGTTGYDFANLVGGLFVDPAGARALQRFHAELSGDGLKFSDIVYESKKLILGVSLSSELHVLTCKLDRISEQHRMSRDFTFNGLKYALAEVIACFPVYRSYIRTSPRGAEISEDDRHHILSAIHKARWKNPALSGSIFDFVASVLLLQEPEDLAEAARAERREFVMRFQQLTGPVMAKGLEDTAFYRYCPLASLNEVGGNAGSLGVTPAAFHAANQERLRKWPGSLLATSTHDTKRGEDMRARISVLSEVHQVWTGAVQRWRQLNRSCKTWLDSGEVPDPADEYLLYQTLLGVWPFAGTDDDVRERIEAYMLKALKEAKRYTSWINPNQAYEQGVLSFIRGILSLDHGFLADFHRLRSLVARAGLHNSLSQVLLKIASPGVPDFYQGSEIWDFNLVDPDNRRPVDFTLRQDLLRSLSAEPPSPELIERLLAAPEDGRIKLHVTRLALRFRRDHATLFSEGEYVPLQTQDGSDHVVAFARVLPAQGPPVIVAAGRRMGAQTRSTASLVLPAQVPADRYRDVLSGREIISQSPRSTGGQRLLPLSDVWAHLSVALLEGIS